MNEIVQELFKLGPAGLVCIVLYLGLQKSEKREEKKDARIQLLENQLIESYDERILVSDRLAEALHGNAVTIKSLIDEIRSRRQ